MSTSARTGAAILLLVLGAIGVDARAAGGFDAAVTHFEVIGASAFVDDFEDGRRDAMPTARFVDRRGSRTTEAGGALRLTDQDGAAPLSWAELGAPTNEIVPGRFEDSVSLTRPIQFGDGMSEVRVSFRPDVPAIDAAWGLCAARCIDVHRGAGGGIQIDAIGPEISPQQITGDLLLRLQISDVIPSAPPELDISASYSIDGGATFVPSGTTSRHSIASLRIFPELRARGRVDVASLHGASLASELVRAPGGALTGMSGALHEQGTVGGGVLSLQLVGNALSPLGPQRPGSFSIKSSGGADLRSSPAEASIATPSGSLQAVATRANHLRRIDVTTGRPIAGNAPAGASCITGIEPDCWQPGEPLAQSERVFEELCRWAIGYSSLDRSLCPLKVFNSQALVVGDSVARIFGFALSPALDPLADAILAALAGGGAAAANGIIMLHAGSVDGPFPANISSTLTDPQEALLGCGPFFLQSATGCWNAGWSLLRSEASAVLQSFPQIDGATGALMNDATVPQPGTAGFLSLRGPTALRSLVPGLPVQLPGARAPWSGLFNPYSALYDPRIDGCVSSAFDGLAPAGTCVTASLVQPFATQPFASELAAFSWNLLQIYIAFSSPDPDGGQVPGAFRYYANEIDEFDEFNPARTDGCSFVRPHDCSGVKWLFDLSTRGLPDDPELPGLRRWIWEVGAEYAITQASGELGLYAGGRLHALGPIEPRVAGHAAGVAFLLEPPSFADTDNDGVADDADDCPAQSNPDQLDTDGDGIGDACDLFVDPDSDGDGIPDVADNCPYAANSSQFDSGSIGAGSPPDGIGDVCQCGDVTGDGRVTNADAVVMARSQLVPPTATMAHPERCNVGGNAGCTTADAVIVRRALLIPPTATIAQVCAPAVP